MIGCSLHVSTQLKRMDVTHDTPVVASLLEIDKTDVSRDSSAITSTLDKILDTTLCKESILCAISERIRDGINWLEG